MALLYACIARDASLLLCDYPTNKDYSKRISKAINSLPMESNTEIQQSGDTKIYIKKKHVYYGVCTHFGIDDEKLQRIMGSLIQSFESFYKGKTEILLIQTNLSAHILDQPFRQYFETLFSNFNTGISTELVSIALTKAEQTKGKIAKNLEVMIVTNEETKNLEADSEDMKNLSSTFLDNSRQLNKTMKNRNWWLCSKCCIITFVVIALCIVALVLGLVYGLKGRKK